LVIDWSQKNKKRVSNQYLFKDIKSIYSIEELNLISTYMFILNTTQVKNQPSDLISIESCWESEVGTYQESTGRYRSSVQGNYFFNYAIVATVYYGPAVFEWSHRCNNCLCVNPSHLIDEPHNVNMSRNKCPGIVFCEYTKRIWILCEHEHKCKHIHVLPRDKMLSIQEYINLN
jgi:hypothetical protein